MDNNEPTPGIGHILANALPLIGRVGAAVGGILGMLAALKAFTNEIVSAIEGLVLISTVVSSAFVIWSRTPRTVDETRVTIPVYSRKNRAVAAVALAVSALLLVAFSYRIVTNFVNQGNIAQATTTTTPTTLALAPSPPFERTRLGGFSATATALALLPSRTPAPSNTSTPPASFTPIPLSQITDVSLLNKLGADALAAKNYRLAFGFYSRALQVDATNAVSQLGYGETHFFLGNESTAQTALRTALQLDPKLVDAHAYLAYLYDQQQDYPRARAEYEEFSRNAPKDSPLIASIRERVNQLSSRNSIPTATPLLTGVPTLSLTQTLTPTLTQTPTLTATQTLTPTRTATPK